MLTDVTRLPRVLVIVAAGCGRVGFEGVAAGDTGDDASGDARLDAPMHPGSLTHDEDGDGVADGLDSCPHVAGAQTDTDGDGVGDLCDSEINNPRQRITLFESFESFGAAGSSPLVISNGWEPMTDRLHWPGASFGFVEWNPHAATDLDVFAGWTIAGKTAAVDHQATISLDDGPTRRTYAELYDDNAGAYVSITHFDGSSYTPNDEQHFGAIHAGAFDMAMHATVSPQLLRVDAGWTGERYTAQTAAVAYTGVTGIGITLHDLDAELRYVMIVESQ
jgi:hypothetical protein